MSVPDIRFDCRFCNKPVKVPAQHAGKRVKCPSCKNPVVVPGQQDTLAASFTEADSSPGELQQVSQRPVTRGGGSLGLGKLIVLIGLAAAAFFGYRFVTGQAKKPLDKLLVEYAAGNPANGPFIQRKLDEAKQKGTLGGFELGELKKYARHKEAGVRSFIMECLGRIANPGAFDTLVATLRKDEDAGVRREAAIALGALRQKKVVAALVEAMQQESDQQVRGGIRQALVALTGQKQFRAQGPEWNTWWGLNQKSFSIPE